ncbi:uncharacterized protein N7483_002659 [Penicillium malachiteum]|uniref:uncharacterized protein n=1 Tax=Penicillium malachiteum TaxID=1324776 RepID=UPI002549B193|nr:uncharacterized protein N7483_002659 [Penicillium malachiteum]KAJ5737534.1 hypothetical protein N7483_002659 [Penicillium malachiteum]
MMHSNFSQIGDDAEYRATLLKLAANQCQIQTDDVEDIYPCTPAQEGLFALSVKSPSSYVARYVYELPGDIDLVRFRRALDATLEAHTVLRTRLIQGNDGTFQVVVRQLDVDQSYNNLDTYLAADTQRPMPPGVPLLRVALLDGQLQSKPTLVLTLHHALYDDWSLNVVLKDIEKVYDGNLLPKRLFADFTVHALEAQSESSATYWRSQLEGSVVSRFPRLPSDSYTPAAKASLIQTVPFLHSMTENEQSAAIELAWALLLSKCINSQEVTFGVTLTGRLEHLPGIKDMSGPTIATIPFHVQLPLDHSVGSILKSLRSTADDMLPFEQLGLYQIGRLGAEASAACQFQTLVVIQSPPQYQYDYLSETTHDHNLLNHATFGTYPVTLVCDLAKGSVRVQAVYDDTLVPPTQMQRILSQLSTILQQMTESAEYSSIALKDVKTISEDDMQQLEHWNGQLPPKVDCCLHELILEHCEKQPGQPAVCAWDGNFTYRDIEDMSRKLAAHMFHSLCVRPENFVPVYFEKSKWTTVAILAVMRTGAAFVLLDPATPLARNKSICERVGARCVLSSVSLVSAAASLADNIIPVGPEEGIFAENPLKNPSDSMHGDIDPAGFSSSNALYAVFTSGSTGTPKGVVIENGSFATSTKAYLQRCDIRNDTRALQFASYAFDVSISDTLVTLVAGGCICVPSEEERKSDIASVVRKYDVNWADFTPSLLRHLPPDQMPSLRSIVLGGEPLSQIEINTWGTHVRLLNIYGPAECCVLSTIQTNVTRTTDPRDIGFAAGCVCWVVDHEDPNQLMPIGAVGELILEGAIVGRGYLQDEEKTAASFIGDPSWIKRFRPTGTSSRFYRTGDLVQYTNQGSLRFVGRRDVQVKLRGQRVELEEVEYHTRNSFPNAEEVVADVLSLDGRPKELVAFVALKEMVGDGSLTAPFLPATTSFHSSVSTANESLFKLVPSFMIPSLYVSVTHIMKTMSDKTDRRRLRESAMTLAKDQVASYCLPPSNATKRPPQSETTIKMQRIWADVLQIPLDRIGLDDGFFNLGGDSITAMKVAGKAKSQGLVFSMSDLFQRTSSLESVVEQAAGTTATAIWDWLKESTIESDVVSYSRKNRICLTGSTGFLGQELLRVANNNPDIQAIHCLAVRAQGAGIARKSSLLKSDKIIYHTGDLSLPNLGMTAESLSSVIQECTVIIHCAADISFVKTYELLKTTNVGATKVLARLALEHSVPFHFVSSAAMSHWAELDKFGEISMRNYPPPLDGSEGYLTSKWVSETYLENCNKIHGLPVTIHRLSSVVGPGAPELDITNNFLKYACKLRAVPNLRGCKGYVDLVSVQTTATNVLADALSGASETAPVKIINESGEIQVKASGLKEYLETERREDQSFQELELHEWVASAQEQGMPDLVAKFLLSMPPTEIDIAMPFLETSRIYDRTGSMCKESGPLMFLL